MARSFKLCALVLTSLAVLVGCPRRNAPTRDTSDTASRLFDDLGTHTHKVTTSSPLAQRYFDQGLRLAYGFNHDEARIAFKEAARIDPDCAMCWWGIAYTLGTNYNLPANPEHDKEAWTAIEKARAASPHATEPERAYVEAIAKRFVPDPPADRYPLDEAWANAIGEVAKRYPNDLDAATIHAEALMDLQPWDLWTHDGKPKGRTLEIVAELERVLKADPQHPGANHYYIHAVEASSDPGRGVPSADRLRAQNLGTGHLVHMPSHIYVRTGRYADATEANAKAMKVDEAYIQKWDVQGDYAHMYYPHNVHFRAFSAGMEGRSAESIENAQKVAGFLTPEMMAHMPMLEGISASTYFTLVRFGHWDAVLAAPAPDAHLKYLNAIRHWARGIAYAAKGRLGEAKAEQRALDAIWSKMPADKLSTQVNKGEHLLGVASNDLAGTIAAKQKKWDEAVRRLEAAVKLEDSLVYMEPADWFNPIRPFLGAVLLEAGRPREAEAVYREDLRRNPENGWSLSGLETSLERQGKTADAAAVRDRFTKAWARADVAPTISALAAAGAPPAVASSGLGTR
jgi:tetratricopeptide (TPR) repeat protein